jgi:hypothetical protein
MSQGIKVNQYDVPLSMVLLANKRTEDILRLWSWTIGRGSCDFQHLAASCYMQGINDALEMTPTEDVSR